MLQEEEWERDSWNDEEGVELESLLQLHRKVMLCDSTSLCFIRHIPSSTLGGYTNLRSVPNQTAGVATHLEIKEQPKST